MSGVALRKFPPRPTNTFTYRKRSLEEPPGAGQDGRKKPLDTVESTSRIEALRRQQEAPDGLFDPRADPLAGAAGTAVRSEDSVRLTWNGVQPDYGDAAASGFAHDIGGSAGALRALTIPDCQ